MRVTRGELEKYRIIFGFAACRRAPDRARYALSQARFPKRLTADTITFSPTIDAREKKNKSRERGLTSRGPHGVQDWPVASEIIQWNLTTV